MTLDELIEALLELRVQCPAAGTARVNGAESSEITYDHGEVWINDGDETSPAGFEPWEVPS